MQKYVYVLLAILAAVGLIYKTNQSIAKKSELQTISADRIMIDELHKAIDLKSLPVQSFDAI